MILTPRHFRRVALAGLALLATEVFLFWLVGREIGLLPLIALMALKGFAGFALLTSHIRSVLRGLALNPFRRGLSGLGSAGLSALGAFLIFLPGILTTLVGLALFAPTVRGWIVRWLQREKRQSARDEVITLDAHEWQDVGTARKPRKRKVVARDLSP